MCQLVSYRGDGAWVDNNNYPLIVYGHNTRKCLGMADAHEK